MSRLRAPAEQAYQRRVLFAAEVIDGVTLARISSGIAVRAASIASPPVINASGMFVWLDTGVPLAPQQVTVDPGLLPFQTASVATPVPPQRLVQIALSPGRGYVFGAGATALRFSMVDSAGGTPLPAAGIAVFLRWFNPGALVPWPDAPLRSRTDANGGASVALRFSRDDEPGKGAAGYLRVRLCAQRAGLVVMSPELALPEGSVTELPIPFDLNLFLP